MSVGFPYRSDAKWDDWKEDDTGEEEALFVLHVHSQQRIGYSHPQEKLGDGWCSFHEMTLHYFGRLYYIGDQWSEEEQNAA